MDATSELQERGFVVIPGPTRPDRLANAYTAAVASATSDDIRIGSTSTKVNDLVNRGAELDSLYAFPPLLEACYRVIGRPFKLSSLHARRLRPNPPSQELHVDVPRGSADWPLLGFILMVDELRPDNGATRFVPGSHRWSSAPEDTISVGPNTMGRCWHAAMPAHYSPSTDPRGMVIQPTRRAGRADHFKARSFRRPGVPGPTSPPAGNPRRVRDSAQSRGMCSRFDRWPLTLSGERHAPAVQPRRSRRPAGQSDGSGN